MTVGQYIGFGPFDVYFEHIDAGFAEEVIAEPDRRNSLPLFAAEHRPGIGLARAEIHTIRVYPHCFVDKFYIVDIIGFQVIGQNFPHVGVGFKGDNAGVGMLLSKVGDARTNVGPAIVNDRCHFGRFKPIKLVCENLFVLPGKRQAVDYPKPKRPHRCPKRLISRLVGIAKQEPQKLPSARCLEGSKKVFK